jgi:hypothetical protein
MRYDIGLGIRLVYRLGLGYIAWNGSVFFQFRFLIYVFTTRYWLDKEP